MQTHFEKKYGTDKEETVVLHNASKKDLMNEFKKIRQYGREIEGSPDERMLVIVGYAGHAVSCNGTYIMFNTDD